MIFRLSQRLATKINAGRLEWTPVADNACADWSCRLFSVEGKAYIMISNTMSLYTCVMQATDVGDRDGLARKTLEAIAEFMTADEQQRAYERIVAPGSDGVTFATSLNQSISRSMNDHVQGSRLLLGDGLAPHDIGFRLNAAPLAALAKSNGRRYASPREVFVNLASTHV